MSYVDWESTRRRALSHWSNGLTDHDTTASAAIRRFATGDNDGVAPVACLRSWLPQHLAPESWRSPLPNLPSGFWPYEFQARAFERLSVANQLPRPTAIAAPEGSGKSECFLLPVLDHCIRQQNLNRPGIKAVVIYASRASAADNAARVAELCGMFPAFQSLRPALLIDDFGTGSTGESSRVIDSIDAIVEQSPDLLLTVPEMVDRTLKSKRYARVWSDTTPVSLRFIVLDDLHFYTDTGIQDLAVLLRRLGTTLGMASPSQPLAGAVPVVTAGIDMAPIADSRGAEDRTDHTTADMPVTTGEVRTQTGARESGHPRSVLPRPTIDVSGGGPGPSGLPSLSTVSVEDPTAGLGGGLYGSAEQPSVLPPLGREPDAGGGASREPNQLLDLAEYLFGVEFKADALVVDSKMTVDEFTPAPDDTLPIPSVQQLAAIPLTDVVAIFRSLFGEGVPVPPDPVSLGSLLITHPVISTFVRITSDREVDVVGIARAIGLESNVPGVAAFDDMASAAVQRLTALIGAARRMVGSSQQPLLRLDTQLTFRSVNHVMRLVGSEPVFSSPRSVDLEDPSVIPPLDPTCTEPPSRRDHYLPAVACRNCGASGWLATLLGHERHRLATPVGPEVTLGNQSGNPAIVIALDGERTGEGTTRLLDPRTLDLQDAAGSPEVDVAASVDHTDDHGVRRAIPVRVVSGTAAVAQRACPECGHQGTIDLIGSGDDGLMAAITTELVSASDTRGDDTDRLIVLTRSKNIVEQQRTTIARNTYLSALRSTVRALLVSPSAVKATPGQIAASVMAAVNDPVGRRRIIPQDLLEDPRLPSLGVDEPGANDTSLLQDRIEFELIQEFGPRVGEANSLVSTGFVTVEVNHGDLTPVVEKVARAIVKETGLELDDGTIETYVVGLLQRLRLDGAVATPLLRQYVVEGGNPSFVTVDRPLGLPDLSATPRPRFVTTAARGEFESISAVHQRPNGARTWLVEWACSTLGINASDAPTINRVAFDSLVSDNGSLFAVDSMDGHRVWGLVSDAVVVATTGGTEPYRESHGYNTVRTASTVGVTPQQKAAIEESFKQRSSPSAANVLYTSAGWVRSDRDVLDTTIDLGSVDLLVVEATAVDEMRTVPEISRVGISSGRGTVIVVEPERGTAVAAAGSSRSKHVRLLETTTSLPAVPDAVRASTADYMDFLLDRVTDDTIHFSYPYETLGEFMALATAVPPSVQGVPMRDGLSGPTPPDPAATGFVHRLPPGIDVPPLEPVASDTGGVVPPATNPASTNIPNLPDGSRISTNVTIGSMGDDELPLFQTLVSASGVEKSLTRPAPVEEYLRTVAPGSSDSDIAMITSFAKGGVAERLHSWLASWTQWSKTVDDGDHALTGAQKVRLEELGDLGALPWGEGISLLQGFASVGEDASSRHDDQAAPGAQPVTNRLPVLDIQGRTRMDSAIAALMMAIEVICSSDDAEAYEIRPAARRDGSRDVVVSVPVGIESAGRFVPIPQLGVALAEITFGPVVGRERDPVVVECLSYLRDPVGFEQTVAEAIRSLSNCRCESEGRDGCDVCLRGSSDRSLAVSRSLALEVLSSLSDCWDALAPDHSVPLNLLTSELRRGFELALWVWLQREPDLAGTLLPLAQPVGSRGFDLSMTFEAEEHHYRIERQGSDDHRFVTYRLINRDSEWPRIGLVLVPHHEIGEQGQVSPDLIEEFNAIRSQGLLPWAVTWSDVADFYDLVISADAADLSVRSLLDDHERENATRLQRSGGGRVSIESLEQNPLSALLDILARPWRDDWAMAATALVQSAALDTTRLVPMVVAGLAD